MYTILGLLVFGIFIFIISLIASLFSKDTSKSFKKVDEEEKLLNQKRNSLNIQRPVTKYQHYPLVKFRNPYTDIASPRPWSTRFDKSKYEFTEARIGNSEYFFLNYLNKYFDTDKLTVSEHMCEWYYPDIVYADLTKNLFIDIEIDEPYSYKMSEPIHFIGKDDERDQKINKAGWHIIRFSERQIKVYPTQCCKIVAEILAYLTLDNSILDKFKNISSLPFEEQWDINKAKELARSKYRNTYN